MELRILREFLVLVETKNYWAASERLFMGQSTLSKHIQQLEKELGAPLFDRTSRKVELTAYGKLLIPYAKTITETGDACAERFALAREAENGKLLLGVIPSMVQYGITDLVMGFDTQARANLIRVVEEDSANLKELLRQGLCEMAFVRESKNWPVDDSDLIKLPYLEDRLVAVLPPTHPLAGQKSIPLAALKDETFILLRQQTIVYRICIEACSRAWFKPNVAFDCHRLDSILDLVTQGMGIALLMDRHVQRPAYGNPPARPAFVAVPVLPETGSSLCLCYRKKAILSKTARQFIRYFEKVQQTTSPTLPEAADVQNG